MKVIKIIPLVLVVLLFFMVFVYGGIEWTNSKVKIELLKFLVLLAVNIASFKVALMAKEKSKPAYFALIGVFLLTALLLISSLYRLIIIGKPW